jgi:chromosome segregation ATPase
MGSDDDLNVTDGGLLDLDEPEAVEASPLVPPPEWPDDSSPLYIDVQGNIHVRGGRFFASRVVGKVRGENGAATVGILVARFEELERRFAALQREVAASHNLVRHLKSMQSFVHWVEGAEAVGDFEGLLERAYAEIERLESAIGASRAAKIELVQRAEELSTSTSWRSTGDAMNDLMEQWKRTPSAGGEEDEALWQRFRTARKTFFSRRSEHYNALKKSRGAAREAKEELIAQAEALSGSTDLDGTFATMQELMEAWKAAGSAGRERDEELWQRFHAARDPFFERRKAHFAEQRQRRQGDRRDRRSGGAPPRGGGRGSQKERRPSGRSAGGGPLHATLGELVGPLKDLFPEERTGDVKGSDAREQKRSDPKKGRSS